MSLFSSSDLKQDQDEQSKNALMRMSGAIEMLRKKLAEETKTRDNEVKEIHQRDGMMRTDIEALHKEVEALKFAQEALNNTFDKQFAQLQAVIEEAVSKQVAGEERLMIVMKQRFDNIDQISELERYVEAEKRLREADVAELREMIGGEKCAREGHHESLQAFMDQESKAREAHGLDLKSHVSTQLGLHGEQHTTHISNHATLSGQIDDLRQALEEERRARDADMAHLRELTGSPQILIDQMEGLQQAISNEKNTREADVFELREIVGGEKMAREGHHASVQELLEAERKAREAHADELEAHKDELKGRFGALDGRLGALDDHAGRHNEHAANHASLVDQVAELERLVMSEKSVREADVYELRELVGGEKLARQSHHASVQEIMEQERKEREAHKNEIQERFCFFGDRVDSMGGNDAGQHEQHASNHVALSDKVADLEKYVQAEKDVREADIYELRKLIGGEQAARQGHHSSIQEILEEERKERENHVGQLAGQWGQMAAQMNDHADHHESHIHNHNALLERVDALEAAVQQSSGAQSGHDPMLGGIVGELQRQLENEAQIREDSIRSLEQQVDDSKLHTEQVAVSFDQKLNDLRDMLDHHNHEFDTPEDDEEEAAPPYAITKKSAPVIYSAVSLPPPQPPSPPPITYSAPPVTLPPQPTMQKTISVGQAPLSAPPMTYAAPQIALPPPTAMPPTAMPPTAMPPTAMPPSMPSMASMGSVHLAPPPKSGPLTYSAPTTPVTQTSSITYGAPPSPSSPSATMTYGAPEAHAPAPKRKSKGSQHVTTGGPKYTSGHEH